MGEIVGKLWIMGLQACALICIVLMARHFLRKYPKIYSYWLWALVGIRLLCPIWIETPFSLQPKLPDALELGLSGTDIGEPAPMGEGLPESEKPGEKPFYSETQGSGSSEEFPESGDFNKFPEDDGSSGKPDSQEGRWTSAIDGKETGNAVSSNHGTSGSGKSELDDSSTSFGNTELDYSSTSSGNTELDHFSTSFGNTELGQSNTSSRMAGLDDSKTPSEKTGFQLFHLLVILYLLGVGITGSVYLVQYLLIKRQLAVAIREKENIWLCENVQTPFVIGLFQPRIIFPYTLTGFERDCVLRHEKTHIRHHDPLIRFVGLLCTCLHWWNPFVWLAVHKMNQDMEMFCDESALSDTTLAERKLYASALLACAKRQSGFLIGLAFGESNTERRVKNIMKKRKGSVIAISLVVLLSVFCTTTLMAAPKNKQPENISENNNGNPSGQDDLLANTQDLTPTPTPAPEEPTSASDLSATPIPAADLTPEADVTPTANLTPQADAALTPEPTPQAEAASTPEAEIPPFDPAASYLKIAPQDNVAVYFNEDKQNPQVIVEYTNEETTQYQVFDWDYDLDYGTPIVMEGYFGPCFFEKDLTETDDFLSDFYSRHRLSPGTVLRVILPAAKPAEPLNPFGDAEFCGVGHTVSCSEKIVEVLPTENESSENIMSFEFPEMYFEFPEIESGKAYGTKIINDAFYQEFLKYSTAGYRTNGDGEEVFTLSLCGNGTLKQYFEYPGLSLSKQETYPIIIEEFSHFTETSMEYRQLGIKVGEDILWLGKFCNNDITRGVKWITDISLWNGDYLFFPDKEIGYYAGDSSTGHLPAEGDLQAGEPYRLEPEDAFDLDGDGVPERIEYRNMPSEEGSSCSDSVLFINGREVLRQHFGYSGQVLADYPYIASLDGKTYQLLIPVFDEHHSCSLAIYQYTDGELHYTGEFTNAK